MQARSLSPATQPVASSPQRPPHRVPYRVIEYDGRHYYAPIDTQVLAILEIKPEFALVALRRQIRRRKPGTWHDAAVLRHFTRRDDGLWMETNRSVTIPMASAPGLEMLATVFRRTADAEPAEGG